MYGYKKQVNMSHKKNRQGGALEVILTLSDDDKKSNQPVNSHKLSKNVLQKRQS